MRYLLLIYTDPEVYRTLSETDSKQLIDDYWAFDDDIAKPGEIQAGEALQAINTATTVRGKDREPLTTDGPFAETKEVLGGFYLVDVGDHDRALELAAKIPDVAWGLGAVEIRPIMEFTRDEEGTAGS